jgi:hypothetical protein
MVFRPKFLTAAMARNRFFLAPPLLIVAGLIAAGCAPYAEGSVAASAPPSPPDRTECAAPPLAVQQQGARPAALRVEVWDQNGLHQGSEVVMVSDAGGNPLVTLECDGPFVSFTLLPGAYRVSAFLGGQHSEDMALRVPPEGLGVMLKLLPPLPAPPPDGPPAD